MARTGISINISDTTLGSPPQVNSNSMLIVVGATATTGGALTFDLNKPYMIHSLSDLEGLGITVDNNKDLYNQTADYFQPSGTLSNSGNPLWLVGVATGANATVASLIPDLVRATTTNGFQYRPRNIIISAELTADSVNVPVADVQSAISELYTEGYRTIAIVGGGALIASPINTAASTLEDMTTQAAPLVSGYVIVTNRQGDRPCAGAVGGYMAQLSVGTSIGDASLPQFGTSMFFIDGAIESDAITWTNTPCSALTLSATNTLGDKGYLFTRTRPPRNGLWWNDGATCEDPANALSTLEAGRTIAAICDDAQSYFTPYINNKIPVNNDGDIRSDYKQVVLSGARSQVLQPWIDSGDISEGEIGLQAKNNDMVGTREWEVSVAILGAYTLRWINGYVRYVTSLNQ